MKRKTVFLGLAVLAAAGMVFSLLTYQGGAGKVQYKTARVERGDVSSFVSATGTLNPVISVQVGSQISGMIKHLYADFNSQVKKGQLITRIDPEIFEARLAQAKANLENTLAAVANQQANLERAEAETENARAAIEVARANIAKAQVAVLDAKTNLDRRTSLLEKGAISQAEKDTAQAAYDSALAQLDAARAQEVASLSLYRSTLSQQKVVKAQLLSAEAQVNQAKAAVTQAQIDLDHTYIRSPVDGIVVSRNVDVGQTVAASLQAPVLFTIAQDLSKMQVNTNVDEADIGRVVLDQEAIFTVDSYPGEAFKGRVNQIRSAPIVVQNVVTYDVVVRVANPDLKLKPGMTANVRILVARKRDVPIVPNAAFRVRLETKSLKKGDQEGVPSSPLSQREKRPGPDMQKIWVLQDGRPLERWVKTGISDGEVTEVLEGIKEGELVIVGSAGKEKASPAQPGRQPWLRF